MKQKLFKVKHDFRVFFIMLGVLFFQNSFAYYAEDEEENNPEEMQFIIVWDNDGGCISFPLSEYPRFDYNIKDSVVNCVTNLQKIDIPLNNIYKYTLDNVPDVPTSIKPSDVSKHKVIYKSNVIYINNTKAGSNVSIFTIDGILISQYKTDADGHLEIHIGSWTSGFFVLNVNNVSYKIYKK